MAPERFDGRSEPRSDVYALGVTLYELLTLRPLFAEPDRTKLIDRVLHDEPAAPRQVDRRIPHDLETIVQKAIAKEPDARYASAAVLAEDLRRFLADEPVLARPLGPAGRLARWCRRQPKLATAIGLAASSLVLATGLSIALAWSQYRSAAAAPCRASPDARREDAGRGELPGRPASGRGLPHPGQRRHPVATARLGRGSPVAQAATGGRPQVLSAIPRTATERT